MVDRISRRQTGDQDWLPTARSRSGDGSTRLSIRIALDVTSCFGGLVPLEAM